MVGLQSALISSSRLPAVIGTGHVPLSSDTGMLPIRRFDDQIGLTDRFIACLHIRQHHLRRLSNPSSKDSYSTACPGYSFTY